MWRNSTRYAHEIRQVLIQSPERKWKFYICQLLKDFLEETLSAVRKIMFYEVWNSHDDPRGLLHDYYDERYGTVFSAYATQIIAFFREQDQFEDANRDAFLPDGGRVIFNRFHPLKASNPGDDLTENQAVSHDRKTQKLIVDNLRT